MSLDILRPVLATRQNTKQAGFWERITCVTARILYIRIYQMNLSCRMPTWPCLVGAVVFAYASPRTLAVETAGTAQFHQKIQPLLEQYCYQCHGDGMHKGNVAFDELKSTDQILNHD